MLRATGAGEVPLLPLTRCPTPGFRDGPRRTLTAYNVLDTALS